MVKPRFGGGALRKMQHDCARRCHLRQDSLTSVCKNSIAGRRSVPFVEEVRQIVWVALVAFETRIVDPASTCDRGSWPTPISVVGVRVEHVHLVLRIDALADRRRDSLRRRPPCQSWGPDVWSIASQIAAASTSSVAPGARCDAPGDRGRFSRLPWRHRVGAIARQVVCAVLVAFETRIVDLASTCGTAKSTGVNSSFGVRPA